MTDFNLVPFCLRSQIQVPFQEKEAFASLGTMRFSNGSKEVLFACFCFLVLEKFRNCDVLAKFGSVSKEGIFQLSKGKI